MEKRQKTGIKCVSALSPVGETALDNAFWAKLNAMCPTRLVVFSLFFLFLRIFLYLCIEMWRRKAPLLYVI